MDKLKDPRTARLAVYVIAGIVGVIGIVSGIVDHETVSAWFAADGIVGYIGMAVVSLLASANINQKPAPAVEESRKTVDDLSAIRRRMAG